LIRKGEMGWTKTRDRREGKKERAKEKRMSRMRRE
jgi:hypothetical protein